MPLPRMKLRLELSKFLLVALLVHLVIYECLVSSVQSRIVPYRLRHSNGAVATEDFQDISAKVFQHIRLMEVEGACRIPRRKIVRIPNKDRTKVYTPRATLLFRCGNDSGCCRNPKHRCSVKTEEKTVRYVLVNSLVGRTQHMFERIVMNNHTSCECR
ncbi:Uncharacterised protein g4996 [Pycnogonum litorale]